MCDRYEIQFYPLNTDPGPLGFDRVDSYVHKDDTRQIMANWYVNSEEEFFRYADDVGQGAVDWCLTGVFIVRNAKGDIVERVTSNVVKSSPEIDTADPRWSETPDDLAGELFPELNEP